MDENELCRKRLLDLSAQADRRGIVTFSGFLNLNEQNIYHAALREFRTQTQPSGGYEGAERQMIAFIPDALSYEWEYPIRCILVRPQNEKFAEKLTHRDLLGAIMHLGIDRSRIGDLVCRDGSYYVFCEAGICPFLMENLTRARHTTLTASPVSDADLSDVRPTFREQTDQIASNRIDCIIARAWHLSRSQAAECISGERVFLNGRCVTDCNQACESGTIVSVRGMGRFIFETDQSLSKKGKLRVRFQIYQ